MKSAKYMLTGCSELEAQKKPVPILKAHKRHTVPKLEARKRHPVQRHIPGTLKYGSTPPQVPPKLVEASASVGWLLSSSWLVPSWYYYYDYNFIFSWSITIIITITEKLPLLPITINITYYYHPIPGTMPHSMQELPSELPRRLKKWYR